MYHEFTFSSGALDSRNLFDSRVSHCAVSIHYVHCTVSNFSPSLLHCTVSIFTSPSHYSGQNRPPFCVKSLFFLFQSQMSSQPPPPTYEAVTGGSASKPDSHNVEPQQKPPVRQRMKKRECNDVPL